MTAEQLSILDEAPQPPDAADRERIAHDLDTTLFVDAGAGSGKTHALVRRVVSLVESGVPITSIAAITFTERAAAELRGRLRSALDHARTPAAAAAADALDQAPIGTLHAFARRLINDSPFAAGVPPGFTVLDEIESAVAFDAAWDDLLASLLAEVEPEGGPIAGGRLLVELCEFDGFGIQRGMRRIAEDFRANWDLVELLVDPSVPDVPVLDLEPLRTAISDVVGFDVPVDDRQLSVVEEIIDNARLLDSPHLRPRLDGIARLADRCAPSRMASKGSKAKWKRAHGADGPDQLDALRNAEGHVGTVATELVDSIRQQRRLLLGAMLRRFVLDGARERIANGGLEFHDLLVVARRLVRDHPSVRRELHHRYTRLLLDEFQDTDPIQLELAVRITAPPDDPAHGTDWRGLQPVAGRLFMVGDPKQSIYRFRRADIAQYLRAPAQVGADEVGLTANFRSTAAVIDFANDVFGELIRAEPDRQPGYTPLIAARPAALRGHGSVHALGVDRHDDLRRGDRRATPDDAGPADALRAREADEVAAAITTALATGWQVADGDGEALRPCRPGDITVLLPTRLSLPALEASLEAARIDYRAENSSVVYASPGVRELLLTLRAADDTTDALAAVEVLRTPLYGCSDPELYEWANAGGTFNVWVDPPSGLERHRVADGLAHLRTVAERVPVLPPSDLIAAIADERRVVDLALAGSDPADAWRRIRFTLERARAWSDAGGRGIRRYLAWAYRQAADLRVDDVVLPETDHDAVRVMTIHAAKGLQFPITIVAGMTTQPRPLPTAGVVWTDTTWMLTGRGDDGLFDERAPIEEQFSDAERRRLLYVACTRAVDHLVVSLHRMAPAVNNSDYTDQSRLTAAELLWVGGAADPAIGGATTPLWRRDLRPPASAPPTELEWLDESTWADEHRRTMRRAHRPTTIAATRLAAGEGTEIAAEADDPGLAKDAPADDRPPWRRGRYGTNIGRAVHAVLQRGDLRSGADIADLATAYSTAEGVGADVDEVIDLVESIRQATVVRAAADGAQHWRELFVAAPLDDRVIEGYVDLLVRTPSGLVIVDYKTDRWSGRSAERSARYRLQLAAYGVALGAVVDEPTVGGVVVHARAGQPAEELPVADWPAALDEVCAIAR
ncbi:MAG: UvrD-helicase domain-containing protein [Actinomycetota bacterium]